MEATEKPAYKVETREDGKYLIFSGEWKIQFLENYVPTLGRQVLLDVDRHEGLIIDFSRAIFDTAGALLISKLFTELTKQHVTLTWDKTSPQARLIQPFLDKVRPRIPKERGEITWNEFLQIVGRHTFHVMESIKSLLTFFGEVIVHWVETFRSHSQIRWVSVYHHIEDVGIRAVPIIFLISFLIGMVLSYQSINQLSRFGAEIFTVDFLGISILREIGVLLTAVVVAGRSGSSFTAQIGTMALNQEIDAIRMLGLNPIRILVLPRIIGLTIALPLLVFIADISGLFGGFLTTTLVMKMSPLQFLNQLNKAISQTMFWVGMSKAPLFAILISLVGCFRGLQVRGSAESVGRMTTRSVVEAIFLVIVCDAFMSILFSYLKI